MLRAFVTTAAFTDATVTTDTLELHSYPRRAVDVLVPGNTTVQDLPGARRAVARRGAAERARWTTAPSASATASSATPTARPASSAPGPDRCCASRATPPSASPARGAPGRRSTAIPLPRGPRSRCGRARPSRSGNCTRPGLRGYLLVRGGFDTGLVLGSASTFTLGGFGGHGGRELRTGDVLHLGLTPTGDAPEPALAGADPAWLPELTHEWEFARGRRPPRRPPTSSPRRAWARSTPPSGRCTTTRRARACAWSARRSSGPAPTAAKRGCTRRTCTTRRTRWARSTSPATCRSSSGPTGRASAASPARSP